LSRLVSVDKINPLHDSSLAAAETKTAEASAATPQQHSFPVTVPPGALPGQHLQVPSPDGQLVQFIVPDVAAGAVILVPYTPVGTC
jgi:hypothetical protein